jgi:hypothetical protein
VYGHMGVSSVSVFLRIPMANVKILHSFFLCCPRGAKLFHDGRFAERPVFVCLQGVMVLARGLNGACGEPAIFNLEDFVDSGQGTLRGPCGHRLNRPGQGNHLGVILNRSGSHPRRKWTCEAFGRSVFREASVKVTSAGMRGQTGRIGK